MLNILEINDFSAPELDIYARRTEAQLVNKDNPEAGLFIAESPKVIGRALDVDYIPVSVLVEKHQMEENEELNRRLQEAQEALEDRRIAIGKAGTLAEAALRINGIFEAADRAASQYLENIRLAEQEKENKA